MFNTFDASKEKPLTMGELARAIYEKYDKEYTTRTLSIWITVGRVRKSDKQIIKMDGMQMGGYIHSSMEAYERFNQKLNEAPPPEEDQ